MIKLINLLILILLIKSAHFQERFILNTAVNSNEIKDNLISTTSSPLPVVNPTKVPLQKLVCPANVKIPIFSLPCGKDDDCKVFGNGLVCCKERCIKGVIYTVKLKQRETATTKAPAPAVAIQEKPKLVCPGKETRVPFFSLPCQQDNDCKVFGPGLLCCRQRCLQSIAAPKPEAAHQPTLFGLVDRACPTVPIAEILDVKQCQSDLDCTPRICCQEKIPATSKNSYCRTPMHKIENLPGAKQIQEPLRNFISYMQCTQPPPLDLFPKVCNSTLDCFPNLCCQENGKKFCRPPKRSIFSFVVGVTSRIGASDATKRFIERISK